MTLSAYPFDGVDTTETEFSILFQHLQDDGLATEPGSSDGKVTPLSGMTVSVAPFDLAMVGGFASRLTIAEDVQLDSGGSNGRIDRVVLRVDPGDNSVALTTVRGAESTSPSAPALTQQLGGVWEIPLARVRVNAKAVNVIESDITDERRYLGLRVGQWTTSARPLDATVGAMGFNHTTGSWEYLSAEGWKPLAPEVTWGTISGKPSTFAPSSHTHSWSSITSKPSTFKPSSHTHDDRYYTRSAIDSALARKQNNIGYKAAIARNNSIGFYWASPNIRIDVDNNFKKNLQFRDTDVYTNGGAIATKGGQIDTGGGHLRTGGGSLYTPGGRAHTVSSSYVSAYINGDGRLGYAPSTREKKNPLGEYVPDVEGLLAVPGRWYTYKDDELQTPRAAMFAEDLNEVAPEFVIHEDGKPAGIRYEQLAVSALLVAKALDDRLKAIEAALDLPTNYPTRTEPGEVTDAMRERAHELAADQRAEIEAAEATTAALAETAVEEDA